MNFSFATCVRSSALRFIQQVYSPQTITDTPDSAGPLLDFVEKDIVRVQDPMMHGNRIEVLPGTNYVEDTETRAAIIKACRQFHNPPTKEQVEG